MMSALKKLWHRLPVEALCWFIALLLLALNDTVSNHFTLCPLKNAGFDFCPGCGLGRSVTLFFHGDILSSLRVHPLGVFAVIVLSFRIIRLTKHYLQYNYGKGN